MGGREEGREGRRKEEEGKRGEERGQRREGGRKEERGRTNERTWSSQTKTKARVVTSQLQPLPDQSLNEGGREEPLPDQSLDSVGTEGRGRCYDNNRLRRGSMKLS